jgi:DNA-binding transcriptional MerR regulator
MSTQPDPDAPPALALELFQPKPNILYSLDAAAQLADVPRRSILIYCRAGLICPILQPPHGALAFTEEAIYTVRRIEQMRTLHGLSLAWIKTLFDLTAELERLRAEVQFWRNR